MGYKKFSAAVLLSALLAFSATASAATYSVEDSEVRSTLKNIKGQIETIQQYLDIVKEKQVSLDLLNKTSVERKNDSMTKLSGSLSSGFVGDLKKNTDISSVIGLTSGGGFGGAVGGGLKKFDFAGDLMKIMGGEVKFSFNQTLQSALFQTGFGEYSEMLAGPIADMLNMKDPDAIKTSFGQTKQQCAYLHALVDRLANEKIREVEKRRSDAVGRLKDIGNAKDEKPEGKDKLMATLGSYSSILSQGTGGIGTFSYGSVLSPELSGILMNTEGTSSITASQEKTTLVEGVGIQADAFDAEIRSINRQRNIAHSYIAMFEAEADDNLGKALCNATIDKLSNLNINRTGVVHKRAFEGRFGSWSSGAGSNGTGVVSSNDVGSGSSGIDIGSLILH